MWQKIFNGLGVCIALFILGVAIISSPICAEDVPPPENVRVIPTTDIAPNGDRGHNPNNPHPYGSDAYFLYEEHPEEYKIWVEFCKRFPKLSSDYKCSIVFDDVIPIAYATETIRKVYRVVPVNDDKNKFELLQVIPTHELVYPDGRSRVVGYGRFILDDDDVNKGYWVESVN